MMRMKKALVFMLVLALAAAVMAGCMSPQVSAELFINSDGTGTRHIVTHIDKKDNKYDEWGKSYDYLKKHGDELQVYLVELFKTNVPGSEEWLTITVDNTGERYEVITMSFDFTSFEEYKTRLRAMAWDNNHNGSYADPEIILTDGKITGYVEPESVLKSILNSVDTAIMADDTIYDETANFTCTASASDKAEHLPNQVMIIDPTKDVRDIERYGMYIQVDGGEIVGFDVKDGAFTYDSAKEYEVEYPIDGLEEKPEPTEPEPTETQPQPTESKPTETQPTETAPGSSSGDVTGEEPSNILPIAIGAVAVLVVLAAVIVIIKKRKK